MGNPDFSVLPKRIGMYIAVVVALVFSICFMMQRFFEYKASDQRPLIPSAPDLREAVRTGNIERVRELLASGADVNASYENGFTPIYFASDPKVVDLLLAHGARLDIRDAASIMSPIENAAERYSRDEAHRETWKLIVRKLRDAGAEYTIDAATYLNDVEFVKEQLAKGDSWVNERRDAQSVPLRLAARTGRVEICKLLLAHGADPDAFEEGHGWPIMVYAVGHPDVVKLLIEHGANLKRRITWRGGRSGSWIIGDEATALHYAVQAGDLESAKLLVNAGIDPNAVDNDGQTSLHIAIRCEQWNRSQEREYYAFPAIVEYLLANGASVRMTEKNGKTPIQLAKELKSPEPILQALEKRLEQSP